MRDLGAADRVTFISFEALALRAVRDAAPGIPRGLLCDGSATDLVDAALELECGLLSVEWRKADAGVVARAKETGLAVSAWTIRAEDDLEKAIALGAEYFVTDHPARDRARLVRE